MKTSVYQSMVVCLLSVPLGGCVEWSQAPPPSESLFSPVTPVRLASDQDATRPFVGLELEEELLGSLDQLEFGAGLRVVEVAPGSPAERVGIRTGDRLVGAGGFAVNGIDQWQALLDRCAPGDSLKLELEREAGISEVTVAVAVRDSRALEPPRRFVERYKLRAAFETVADDSGPGARVLELFPGSPLLMREIDVGARVIALDGKKIRGGQELARQLAARPYGDSVELEVEDDQGVRTLLIELWEPEWTLTRLSVPILFGYQYEPEDDRVRFSLIDFWLFAVYDYRRDARSARHRFLRFFVFETGVGELTELPGGDAESAR